MAHGSETPADRGTRVGHWHLEACRVYDTRSPHDAPIPPGRPVYLCAAVLDHAQTGHARRPHPVTVVLE
jgi:hypothetical protein